CSTATSPRSANKTCSTRTPKHAGTLSKALHSTYSLSLRLAYVSIRCVCSFRAGSLAKTHGSWMWTAKKKYVRCFRMITTRCRFWSCQRTSRAWRDGGSSCSLRRARTFTAASLFTRWISKDRSPTMLNCQPKPQMTLVRPTLLSLLF
ncbi:hypothetical protein LPJ77_006715, partial [Coemansia sp. RSA 2523]